MSFLNLFEYVRSETSATERMTRDSNSSHGSAGAGEVTGGGSGARTPAHRSAGPEKWWKIHLFRGMVNDIRRRAPYFWSDWRDAWDYRVVPATVYMYFAKYGNAGRLFPLSFSNMIGSCQPIFCILPFVPSG